MRQKNNEVTELKKQISDKDKNYNELLAKFRSVQNDFDLREEKMLTRFCLILNEKKAIIAAMQQG